MPVFSLTDEVIFPSPELAGEDGLLAVGGDLGMERLLKAYALGIFPWYSDGSPVLWWSPDPRLVLFPDELKVSRSMRRLIKKEEFKVTFDMAFEDVIENCAVVHKNDDGGTWITDDMISAYVNLHYSGFAHSVEIWHKEELAGGLYGVSMGNAFFGESMFTLRSNASKVAFVKLVERLRRYDFKIIDCQVTTAHLKSFGAREIRRTEFMTILRSAVPAPSPSRMWGEPGERTM